MIIGYIRKSKDKQATILQEDALTKQGCDKFFSDSDSGAKEDRPQFMEMLKFARPGDTIVVWKLDRLSRSLKQLIETVSMLNEKGINLVSLKESIDTTTATGKLMFHVIGALAEFERDLIRERTNAGLEAARARGRVGGRPSIEIDPKRLQRARELYDQKEMLIPEIMKVVGIKSKTTFYKYVVNSELGEYNAK